MYIHTYKPLHHTPSRPAAEAKSLTPETVRRGYQTTQGLHRIGHHLHDCVVRDIVHFTPGSRGHSPAQTRGVAANQCSLAGRPSSLDRAEITGCSTQSRVPESRPVHNSPPRAAGGNVERGIGGGGGFVLRRQGKERKAGELAPRQQLFRLRGHSTRRVWLSRPLFSSGDQFRPSPAALSSRRRVVANKNRRTGSRNGRVSPGQRPHPCAGGAAQVSASWARPTPLLVRPTKFPHPGLLLSSSGGALKMDGNGWNGMWEAAGVRLAAGGEGNDTDGGAVECVSPAGNAFAMSLWCLHAVIAPPSSQSQIALVCMGTPAEERAREQQLANSPGHRDHPGAPPATRLRPSHAPSELGPGAQD